MSECFYADLPVHKSLLAISEPGNFVPVPSTWLVALSDVQNSTRAIEAGRYKEVNLVGASTITALLNLDRSLAMPFVFGGDGATVLLPPRLEHAARNALLHARALASQQFELTLRVALIPIAKIMEAGYEVRIAKLRRSAHYEQALFMGGGLRYATELLKGAVYTLTGEPEGEADYSGLECRWQDVPSKHGETLSLLVQATRGEVEADGVLYRELLQQIEAIYGTDEEHRPIHVETLRPSTDPRQLLHESKIRAPRAFGGLVRYLAEIWGRMLLFKQFIRHPIEVGGVRWDRYVEELVATSDYKKYEDSLYMVLSGRPAQRAQLEAYLDKRHTAGELLYGLHVSDRALLTCVVFERMGQQVHFVDGADGGYALAAKALKQRQQARQG